MQTQSPTRRVLRVIRELHVRSVSVLTVATKSVEKFSVSRFQWEELKFVQYWTCCRLRRVGRDSVFVCVRMCFGVFLWRISRRRRIQRMFVKTCVEYSLWLDCICAFSFSHEIAKRYTSCLFLPKIIIFIIVNFQKTHVHVRHWIFQNLKNILTRSMFLTHIFQNRAYD